MPKSLYGRQTYVNRMVNGSSREELLHPTCNEGSALDFTLASANELRKSQQAGTRCSSMKEKQSFHIISAWQTDGTRYPA
jgi:hypothetical protein